MRRALRRIGRFYGQDRKFYGRPSESFAGGIPFPQGRKNRCTGFDVRSAVYRAKPRARHGHARRAYDRTPRRDVPAQRRP